MASTDKPESESGKLVSAPPASIKWFGLNLTLRVLLLAACVVAVVVMVTSKQTELTVVSGFPFPVPVSAKFNHSPAFIYFVAALSIAGLYSIITIFASLSAMIKPACSTKALLHFALLDVIMVGIVASATGTAGGIAYVGLKGNDHVRWTKICGEFDKFCRHVGSSIAVSLFAAVLLVLLTMLSIFSLYKRIRH